MERADKLTLDTNVINDWAWCEGKIDLQKRHGGDQKRKLELAEFFQKLKLFRDNGVCELAITSQIFADHHQTPERLPAYIHEMVGPYVSIAAPGFGVPTVVPFAVIDPGELDRLFADTFPNSKPQDKKYRSNRTDALQLYAHKIAERDYFLTGEKTNRWPREVLRDHWQIRVLSLSEYLEGRAIELPKAQIDP